MQKHPSGKRHIDNRVILVVIEAGDMRLRALPEKVDSWLSV